MRKRQGIEIIVAINKIDKPSANVERVKQELSEYESDSRGLGRKYDFCTGVCSHRGRNLTICWR